MLKFSMIIALLACATAPVYAQYDRAPAYAQYDRAPAYAQYDRAPAYAQYDRAQECWNPRAGHFERVRSGETQNDLDFSRCRLMGDYRASDRDVPRDCWNPRAGHFEGVRRGERQA